PSPGRVGGDGRGGQGVRGRLADIALPVPLPPLTYEIPAAWAPLAQPGARVRVRMGPRRLIGVIVRTHDDRPEGVTLRPVEEILDRAPILPPDLLELASFIADYYMAPI